MWIWGWVLTGPWVWSLALWNKETKIWVVSRIFPLLGHKWWGRAEFLSLYLSYPSNKMGHDVCLILLTKDTGISPITGDTLPVANRFRIQGDSQILRITPCGSVHLKDVQTLYCQDTYNSVNFTLSNNNKIQMALLLNLLCQEKIFPSLHWSWKCLIQAASVSWSQQGNIQNTQEPRSKPEKSRACSYSL